MNENASLKLLKNMDTLKLNDCFVPRKIQLSICDLLPFSPVELFIWFFVSNLVMQVDVGGAIFAKLKIRKRKIRRI